MKKFCNCDTSAKLKKLRVGRIRYLNTDPFFNEDLPAQITVVEAPPRQLGRLIRGGRLMAGAVSLVDFWSQRRQLEPLGCLGISVRRKVRSVLLFSKKHLIELSGEPIGVTDQTATSVYLLRAILEKRYGLKARLRRGFRPDDVARLLIGDEALVSGIKGLPGFPYMVDLGEEWFRWQKLPFVFARWAVRKSVPPPQKRLLRKLLENALNENQKRWKELSLAGARRLPVKKVRQYFAGLRFQLSHKEIRSEKKFIALWKSIR